MWTRVFFFTDIWCFKIWEFLSLPLWSITLSEMSFADIVIKIKQSFRISMIDFTMPNVQKKHCVKNVQIRSYFWSVFSCIRTEYGPKITPYLDTFHAVKVILMTMLAKRLDASEYRKIRTRNKTPNRKILCPQYECSSY